MHDYVVLLRGINVGGKNKIAMAELKKCLEKQGCKDVVTLINSGNVLLRSDLNERVLGAKIEAILPRSFKLDSSVIKVLVIEGKTFESIVSQAPKEFGKNYTDFRYDIIFLIGINPGEARLQMAARPKIDEMWQGDHAIYYRRPSLASPNATKSYLSKIAQRPIYQLVTIRNWNTTLKLLEMLRKLQA